MPYILKKIKSLSHYYLEVGGLVVFGETQENEEEHEEHEERKDKNVFLLKRIKTFNLNGYWKTSSFEGTNRKFRRFSS